MMKTGCLRLLICYCLLAFCITAKAQHNSLFVQGHINNVQDHDMNIILYEPKGIAGGVVRWDMSENDGRLNEGRVDLIFPCTSSGTRYFEFSYSVDFPWSMMEVGFWAGKGDTIRIDGDGYLNGTWNITTGRPEQQEQNFYQQACMAEITAYQHAIWEYAKYKEWRRDAPEMSEEEWDKTTMRMKQLESRMDSLQQVWKQSMIKVMKERPVGNVWVQNFVSLVERGNLELAKEMKQLYLQKELELEQRPDADLLWSMVNQATQAKLLNLCIDGEMYDLNNRIYHLKDFRGKYVLIDFWSRFCGPCIAEFPVMADFYERHKDKLVMISLTTDDEKAWRECTHHSEITWLNLCDGKGMYGLAGSYGLQALPTLVLISPEGIWYKRWVGSDNIFENGVLENIINGKKSKNHEDTPLYNSPDGEPADGMLIGKQSERDSLCRNLEIR